MKRTLPISSSRPLFDSQFKMAVILNRSRYCGVLFDVLKPFVVRTKIHTTQKALNNTTNVTAFDDPQVKALLRRLTGKNLDKIFATRKEKGLDRPSYKLMTDEELVTAESEIEHEAGRYLEMPPVMEERQESNVVLERRPELEGYSDCNIVFTDISDGTTNRDRHIVVHEHDGTLREARWTERDRMNLMFFQQEGQSYGLPSVLQDEHLQNAFNRDGHVDVLDLVCNQCEPDSADYIRVHRRTYEDLNTRRAFDLLRSTRHFAGLVYYFVKEKRLAWLLVDMLKRDLISDACDLIRLFHIIYPNSKSFEIAKNESLDGLELVKAYVNIEGPHALLEFLQEDKRTAEAM